MTVFEFIKQLNTFVAQSPENGHAEVLLNYDGNICLDFARADDLRGLVGEHCLALFPNLNGRRIVIREMRKQ